MKNKHHIYVASSYSNEDPKITETNVAISMNACEELWQLGFIPFFTLASHYYERYHYSHSYEEWMEYDFAWLSKCDAVLRLPGKSSGADREEVVAMSLGIPVFYNLEDLKNHFHKGGYNDGNS